MIILAYGIKQPTTGDRGSVFFPALEELCQRMASHTHNGINTAPVSASSISLASVVAPVLAWAPVVGRPGVFSQDVNLPSGFTTTKCLIEVRLDGTDERVYPSIEKISNTAIRLFSGSAAFAYKVYIK